MTRYEPARGDQIIANEKYKGELFGINRIELTRVTKNYVFWFGSMPHKTKKNKFIKLARKTFMRGAVLERLKTAKTERDV
ncbi:MAG: hypothetical protein WCT39_06920 [Candidatus Margulisiibacteriota bacterium]